MTPDKDFEITNTPTQSMHNCHQLSQVTNVVTCGLENCMVSTTGAFSMQYYGTTIILGVDQSFLTVYRCVFWIKIGTNHHNKYYFDCIVYKFPVEMTTLRFSCLLWVYN